MTAARTPNPPVAGHALVGEGRPHDETGRDISGMWGSTSGTGRAKCRCGALSDVLDSSPKRRVWHREHKARLRAENGHPASTTP